jgi:hypothetical protein
LKHGSGIRFWIDLIMALATVALLVVTMLSRDWIETVFSVDLDASSGSLEWLVVAVLAAMAILFSALARWEWKKVAVQSTQVAG